MIFILLISALFQVLMFFYLLKLDKKIKNGFSDVSEKLDYESLLTRSALEQLRFFKEKIKSTKDELFSSIKKYLFDEKREMKGGGS